MASTPPTGGDTPKRESVQTEAQESRNQPICWPHAPCRSARWPMRVSQGERSGMWQVQYERRDRVLEISLYRNPALDLSSISHVKSEIGWLAPGPQFRLDLLSMLLSRPPAGLGARPPAPPAAAGAAASPLHAGAPPPSPPPPCVQSSRPRPRPPPAPGLPTHVTAQHTRHGHTHAPMCANHAANQNEAARDHF